ncbi:hypothetical protein HK101_008353 [Irineochytrium annulatum]|nr:hypothetical protein HK101_008353 [Irineochytrium annulatum]
MPLSFFNATLGSWQPFGTYDSINGANITSEIRYSGNTAEKPKDTIVPKRCRFTVSCPIGYGMYATSQGTGCVFCPKGTYNVLGNNKGPCFDCPVDAQCMGGSSVNVNTGYWLTAFATDASANVSIEVHKCPYPLLCCPEGNCTFGGLCADGFQGPLCADCVQDDAYFWGDQCVACSSSLGMSFWVMMFGTLVGAVVVLLIPADETPTIELLFLYFQVVGYIFESDLGGAIGIGGLNRFFAVISLNFDGMVSDCPVPLRGLGKLMFRFVMPLMLLVYVSLIYIVVRFTQSRVSGAAAVMERFTPRYLKNQSISMICLRAIITTLTFAIMPLTEAALSILQCNDLLGLTVVTNVPSMQCLSTPHIGPLVFSISLLILLLGAVPFLVFVILRKIWMTRTFIYSFDVKATQRLLQCLYVYFKPELWFALPVIMLEKGLISILFTLIQKYDETVQLIVHILVIGGLCTGRIYLQPYAASLDAYLNREICVGWLVLIALREYMELYGATTVARVAVVFVLFIPALLHCMRWMHRNRTSAFELVGAVMDSNAPTSTIGGTEQRGTRRQRETMKRSIDSGRTSAQGITSEIVAVTNFERQGVEFAPVVQTASMVQESKVRKMGSQMRKTEEAPLAIDVGEDSD